ncbi:hypothetical protein V6N12_016343 [Hibiscus sabdariffa]|uniref:RNase H type-1 domain-containing protein n=1 Tax=Hibiscus sabdariffa TaxID=183260 RepID=A0ABR2CF98_9ROSI
MEKIRRSLRFTSSHYVDPIGIAGGLALWWNEGVNITVQMDSKNIIDNLVSINEGSAWYCSFIYGPPYREEKKDFWNMLSRRRDSESCPWCVVGDSNVVTKQDDKLGGNPYEIIQARCLLDFQDVCGMMDLPLKGVISRGRIRELMMKQY